MSTSPPPFGAHQQPSYQQAGPHQPIPHQPGPQHGGPQHGGPQHGGSGQQQRPGAPASGNGLAQPATAPATDVQRRGLWKRSYVIVAVALVVVLAIGGGLAWRFWPGYRALGYQPLSEPTRIPAGVPVSSDWSDAEILDGRVYFASSSSETGAVGVVAMGVHDSKASWTSQAAGTAKGWKTMIALPVGVALFTEPDSASGLRRIAVLGESDGHLLWQRTIGNDDAVLFAGSSAVIADRKGHRLVGVRLTDGHERWSQPDPQSTITADTNVLAVTTPKDLDGPATVFGRPYEPDLTDDRRIVQIGADKSARVIDADSGKILTSRQNVAEPDDEVVAHNGRLIVLQPDDQRIVSYDLDKFGEPRVLYTTQAQNSQMKDVTPCGDVRVCFDEEIGYDGKSATVVALDVADGKQLWRYPLANTETIVPVGEAVLVTTTTPDMTLLDSGGAKVWTHTGEAARLDAGNILEFSKPLSRSPGETALYGRHLGDEAVPLGSFDNVRADTCSWDTAMLACVADKDFVLQRFAS